jgi:hypothetical protein
MRDTHGASILEPAFSRTAEPKQALLELAPEIVQLVHQIDVSESLT